MAKRGPTVEKQAAKLERKQNKAMRTGWSAAGPTFGAQMWDQVRILAEDWKETPKDDIERPLKLAQLKGAAQVLAIRERGMGRPLTVKGVIKDALKLEPLDYRTEAQRAAERQRALRASQTPSPE